MDSRLDHGETTTAYLEVFTTEKAEENGIQGFDPGTDNRQLVVVGYDQQGSVTGIVPIVLYNHELEALSDRDKSNEVLKKVMGIGKTALGLE